MVGIERPWQFFFLFFTPIEDLMFKLISIFCQIIWNKTSKLGLFHANDNHLLISIAKLTKFPKIISNF